MIEANTPEQAPDSLYFLAGSRACTIAIAHNANYDNSGVAKSKFLVSVNGGRQTFNGVIETEHYDYIGKSARFTGKIVPVTSRGVQNYRWVATVTVTENGAIADFEVFEDLDGSKDHNLVGEITVLKPAAPFASHGFQSSLLN